MEILAKIFEIVNNRISLPVSILCAFILFAPKKFLETTELSNFVVSNKSTLWIVFLFSSLLYLYEKAKRFFSFLKSKLAAYKEELNVKKIIKENLESLSPQEEAWIYYCLRENNRTVLATQIKSTAVSLENKHLVYRPNTEHSILETPFTIHKSVWNYLMINKDIFCPNEKLKDPQYNGQVNKFIGSLRSVF